MLPMTVGDQSTAPPQDYWLVVVYMQGLEVFILHQTFSFSVKPVGLCSDQGIS